MIFVHEIQRSDDRILIGIGLENAVLDVLTSKSQLEQCLIELRKPEAPMEPAPLGSFGVHEIVVNIGNDGNVSLFVNGPYFHECRTQSAAIWLKKDEFECLVVEALQGNHEDKKSATA